jgi:hypothetical protein
MSRIQVYAPGDDNYDEVEKAAQAAGTAKTAATERYNEIANAYNAADPGSYLSMPDSDLRISNLEKVFFNRGLVRDADYLISRPAVDLHGKRLHRDARPVLIRKLTDTVMRVV